MEEVRFYRGRGRAGSYGEEYPVCTGWLAGWLDGCCLSPVGGGSFRPVEAGGVDEGLKEGENCR